MFKKILVESLKQVAEYPLLVRIAFLTGFVETLGAFWRFGNTFYVILKHNIDISSLQGSLWEYLRAIFDVAMDNISFGTGFFLLLMGVIGYMFLYPIGHGMMIAYSEHKSGVKAFNIAWKRYFTITIAQATLSVITIWSWHLLAFRYFYDWGILSNVLIQIFVVLVGTFLLVTSFLYAFANVSTVADDFSSSKPVQQAQEALKNSAKIAMDHPFVTIKFLLLSLVLQIRFFLTTLFVIGIPAVLIRFLMQIGLISEDSAVDIVLVTAGILLLASMYINSIVDAFFAIYRYKLYKELRDWPSETIAAEPSF